MNSELIRHAIDAAMIGQQGQRERAHKALDDLLAENERLRAKLAEYDKYVAEFTNGA